MLFDWFNCQIWPRKVNVISLEFSLARVKQHSQLMIGLTVNFGLG